MGDVKSRYIEYDIMRIFACLCVIMIHTAVIFDQINNYDYNTLAYQANNIWGVLSRWAVPAFVMLSGMMVLPKADETSIWKLLINRVLRMVIVYIVWSCVYSFYNVFVLERVYAISKFKTFIDGCFSGEIHMWYLLMLAGLYLISPLLIVLIRNLTRKWLFFWIGMMFLFSSCIPFLVKLNIKFLSVIVKSMTSYMDIQFLGGWTLYFVLGYCIRIHKFTKKEKFAIYILGVISLLFTMCATVLPSYRTGKTMGVLPYEYPNIVLMSTAIMVLVKSCGERIKVSEQRKKQIIDVSGLTFGIYLAHVLLLKILYSIGINVQLFHPLASIPVVAFITFVFGGVLTWIIHKIPIVGKYIA